MYHDAYPPLRRARRGRRRHLALTAFTAALGVAAWTGLLPTDGGVSGTSTPPETASASARDPDRVVPSRRYGWMLDPTLVLGADAPAWGDGVALGSTFRSASTRSVAAIEPPPPPIAEERVRIAPTPFQATARLGQTVPLPVARPSEFRPTRPVEPVRVAARPVRTQTVFRAAIGDDRSFLETLFGIDPPKGTLAYAAVDADAVAISPRRRAVPTPSSAMGSGTAVYDISARTVHLPNGEAIEAHSGLGGSMDDPRYVHLRMRGATPPGTYDLTERERLFHGVRAIRLNPVGGSGAIHGRDGLLAHTYMLGPSGASNGCVSFKDYNVFLQAFLRGEIRRLVVVAGNLQDGPPGTGNRRIGLSDRPGPRASGG